MAGLAEGLQSRGWEVLTEQVYVTGPVPAPLGIVEAVAEGIISAIVLRSPSGVRATRDALGEVRLPSGCLLIAGGPTTAASIEKDWPAHGGQVVLAEAPNPDAVAQAVARACGIVT
jgi:uroporphyrinogen-III synthase